MKTIHEKRKIRVVTALIVLSMICISACTTTYKKTKDWEGRKIDELYWEWGKADEVVDVGPYARVYTWISTWTDNGQVKTCRKSFSATDNGYGEVITGSSYKDCPFITAK